jgi:7-cyano-7-deazaguanine synthase in queuosine biosynthesis
MKTIIEMAREAGWGQAKPHDDCIACGVFDFEAFAALVRADERERIIAANAPAIEKTNAHIKMLEDEIAVTRGNTWAQPEQERYFCQRCGKPVNLTTIHTCTPPT